MRPSLRPFHPALAAALPIALAASGCPTSPEPTPDAAREPALDAGSDAGASETDALVVVPPDAAADYDTGTPSNGCGLDAGPRPTSDAGVDGPPAPDAYPVPITHRAAQRTFTEAETYGESTGSPSAFSSSTSS